jgi:hypothetical protein
MALTIHKSAWLTYKADGADKDGAGENSNNSAAREGRLW